MRELPILFKGPMVRAILDGTKTQTRRIAKITHRTPGLAACLAPSVGAPRPRTAAELCPYGQPGDRLWVRETFCAFGRWETRYSSRKCRDEWHFVDMTMECGHQYAYTADGHSPAPRCRTAGVTPCWWKRPAIFMPRVASRITLEIIGVRVQRLQDISEADASAEGVAKHEDGKFSNYLSKSGFAFNAASSFRSLWESINGHDSWDANPWVWAVDFRKLP